MFTGTRAPGQNLVAYLAAGDSLEEFLGDFPSVRREQDETFLQRAKDALLEREAA